MTKLTKRQRGVLECCARDSGLRTNGRYSVIGLTLIELARLELVECRPEAFRHVRIIWTITPAGRKALLEAANEKAT